MGLKKMDPKNGQKWTFWTFEDPGFYGGSEIGHFLNNF